MTLIDIPEPMERTDATVMHRLKGTALTIEEKRIKYASFK